MKLFEDGPYFRDDSDDLKPRTGAVVSLCAAVFLAYCAYYFHEKSVVFGAEGIKTTGRIVSVEKDTCHFTDFCWPEFSNVLVVAYQFKTMDGKSITTALRHPGAQELNRSLHSVGKTRALHYLKSDPHQIAVSDLEMNLRKWVLAKFICLAGVIANLVFAFMYVFRLQFPFPDVWSDPG